MLRQKDFRLQTILSSLFHVGNSHMKLPLQIKVILRISECAYLDCCLLTGMLPLSNATKLGPS
jgi:hypothetical protein